MQKINTMYVTSQIIWGLRPPFSVNSIHSLHSRHSVRSAVQPIQPVHSVRSVQPVFSITCGNSCRRRRTLWRRLHFIHQGTQNLFWWHWRYAGSKKLLGCTKLWNNVSSLWEIVTNENMTIFPWKNFYCSHELANQRAALGRCWMTPYGRIQFEKSSTSGRAFCCWRIVSQVILLNQIK